MGTVLSYRVEITGNPVSVNHLYRGGRRFLTNEGKAIKIEYARQVRGQFSGIPQFSREHMKGPVEVSVIFRFKDRRKHDIDNCLKALFDSMKGILWEDDNQVYKLHVEKQIKTDLPPGIILEIQPIQ